MNQERENWPLFLKQQALLEQADASYKQLFNTMQKKDAKARELAKRLEEVEQQYRELYAKYIDKTAVQQNKQHSDAQKEGAIVADLLEKQKELSRALQQSEDKLAVQDALIIDLRARLAETTLRNASADENAIQEQRLQTEVTGLHAQLKSSRIELERCRLELTTTESLRQSAQEQLQSAGVLYNELRAEFNRQAEALSQAQTAAHMEHEKCKELIIKYQRPELFAERLDVVAQVGQLQLEGLINLQKLVDFRFEQLGARPYLWSINQLVDFVKEHISQKPILMAAAACIERVEKVESHIRNMREEHEFARREDRLQRTLQQERQRILEDLQAKKYLELQQAEAVQQAIFEAKRPQKPIKRAPGPKADAVGELVAATDFLLSQYQPNTSQQLHQSGYQVQGVPAVHQLVEETAAILEEAQQRENARFENFIQKRVLQSRVLVEQEKDESRATQEARAIAHRKRTEEAASKLMEQKQYAVGPQLSAQQALQSANQIPRPTIHTRQDTFTQPVKRNDPAEIARFQAAKASTSQNISALLSQGVQIVPNSAAGKQNALLAKIQAAKAGQAGAQRARSQMMPGTPQIQKSTRQPDFPLQAPVVPKSSRPSKLPKSGEPTSMHKSHKTPVSKKVTGLPSHPVIAVIEQPKEVAVTAKTTPPVQQKPAESVQNPPETTQKTQSEIIESQLKEETEITKIDNKPCYEEKSDPPPLEQKIDWQAALQIEAIVSEPHPLDWQDAADIKAIAQEPEEQPTQNLDSPISPLLSPDLLQHTSFYFQQPEPQQEPVQEITAIKETEPAKQELETHYQLEPEYPPEPEQQPAPEPESEPKPEPQPQLETEPETHSQLGPEPEPHHEPEPQQNVDSQSQQMPPMEQEPEPKLESQLSLKQQPELEHQVESQAKPETRPDSEPESPDKSQPQPQSEPALEETTLTKQSAQDETTIVGESFPPEQITETSMSSDIPSQSNMATPPRKNSLKMSQFEGQSEFEAGEMEDEEEIEYVYEEEYSNY